MTDLSEVAASVAKALGLKSLLITDINPGWLDTASNRPLRADGSNLTLPYWQIRCRDWLVERGNVGFLMGGEAAQFYVPECAVGEEIGLQCPAAEFCARAVHAIVTREGK